MSITSLNSSSVELTQITSIGDVSKHKAKELYCGLGENWWKTIVDGSYHPYGKMVFDQGLHGHEVEPGFIDSASKTYHFVADHLMESPSEDLYKAIHKSACSHFKGKLTQTEIGAELTGIFRDEAISYPLRKDANKQLREDFVNFHLLEIYEEDLIKGKTSTNEYSPAQLKILQDSANRVAKYKEDLQKQSKLLMKTY